MTYLTSPNLLRAPLSKIKLRTTPLTPFLHLQPALRSELRHQFRLQSPHHPSHRSYHYRHTWFNMPSHDNNRKGSRGNRGGGGNVSREVTVSKALSYLLRHAAEREGLKIDAQGYANVANVMAWRKLKSLKVTFPEIIDAVETSDKKRFALFYAPPKSSSTQAQPELEPTEEETAEPAAKNEEESTTATASALLASKSDQAPIHYLIRATQGHSIKSVEAEALLERLTLDAPEKLPETVVHGTYHSTWPLILSSGGLRCMGRNHVHFATGPKLNDVLGVVESIKAQGDDISSSQKPNSDPGSGGKVISGMRQDAQVLVYIDIKRALAAGCPFWRSENGVILSEGMDVGSDEGEKGKDEGGNVMPVEFFDVVVERGKGLGKLWEGGEVLQSLPEELTSKRGPKGGKKR